MGQVLSGFSLLANLSSLKAVVGASIATAGILLIGSALDPSTAPIAVPEITSDRNVKADAQPVNGRELLEKLIVLPITIWSDTNNPRVRHIGPAAQDFKAAFAVGDDDKHIATVDADGVALAALQGLHQILREKESEIASLNARITLLGNRLLAVESALSNRPPSAGNQAPRPPSAPTGLRATIVP